MPSPKHAHHRFGSASTALVIATLGGTLGALYAISPAPSFTASSAGGAYTRDRQLLRQLDVSNESLIRHAGINPETLATVGATSAEVSLVVTDAVTHLENHKQTLLDAFTAVKSTQQLVGTLESLAQSGRASLEDLGSLATARSELASARSTLDTARAALFNAATADLSGTQRTALNNIRNGRALGHELLTPFLVTLRTEADRVAIRDALSEQRTLAEGASLSQNSQDVLAAAREDAPTLQAESDLESRLSANTIAWNEALD